PVHAGPGCGILLDALDAVHGNIDDALAIHFEHALALYRRGRVVQMDDGLVHALERLEALDDQVITRLGQHGDGDIVGDLIRLDQPAHEIIVVLTGGREADHDLLHADVDQ